MLAALLHATWNALLKWQPDAIVGMNIFLVSTTVFSLLGVFYFGVPDADIWLFIIPSLVLHLLYHLFLLSSYRIADFNLAYPILRGAAPLFAALFALLFLGETPTPLSAVGIISVCGGVLLLAKGAPFRAVLTALITAVLIATYSVVDASGARQADSALQYAVWVMLLDSVLFLPIALKKRGLSALLSAPKKVYLCGSIGGLCNVVAYSLVLFAYTNAPVGAVAALREVSVIFGALIGYYLLKEKTAIRIPGAIVVALGVMLIISGNRGA